MDGACDGLKRATGRIDRRSIEVVPVKGLDEDAESAYCD